MIRHSKSLFASIILHSILILVLIVAYKNWPQEEEKEEKKIVSLKMAYIAAEKPPVAAPKVVPPPPKIIEKPKPKPKKEPEKKIVKKVVKKKEVQKPKPQKKKIPVTFEAPKEIIEEVVVQEKPKPVQQFTDHVPQEIFIEEAIETPQEKAFRIEKDYLNEHLQEIGRLLRENLYYPRSARKRGITGEVTVKFKLLKNGEIEYTKVINSKSKILTKAAIKTIEDLSGEFPKPKEDLVLHVPINYSLK